MRLHRFFSKEPLENKEKIIITDENILHQWKKVFRLEAGDRLVLFDGLGKEYECLISLLSKENAQVIVENSREILVPSREIWLCVALIKKDNFEWIVQKATELGVSHIVPVFAKRSEKKDLNINRLEKIAIEASEQCGRGDISKIYTPKNLTETLLLVSKTQKYVFDYSGDTIENEECLNRKPISLFIGPEGGWTPEELAVFTNEGALVKKLSTNILRAETAAITASVLFSCFWLVKTPNIF